MRQTYNILSLLLDYPTQELRDNLARIPAIIREECVFTADEQCLLQQFMEYAASFPSLRDWQAAYTAFFDTSTKANLYLFDFVYGTSKDRGQAMVDLKEEYLKAGLMPPEDELPDYLPIYLQYVSAFNNREEAKAALADIQPVLEKMQEQFAKEDRHPYLPLIQLLCHQK